jgi:hypothetical protein
LYDYVVSQTRSPLEALPEKALGAIEAVLSQDFSIAKDPDSIYRSAAFILPYLSKDTFLEKPDNNGPATRTVPTTVIYGLFDHEPGSEEKDRSSAAAIGSFAELSEHELFRRVSSHFMDSVCLFYSYEVKNQEGGEKIGSSISSYSAHDGHDDKYDRVITTLNQLFSEEKNANVFICFKSVTATDYNDALRKNY